jgi:hypothetical protein
MAAREEEERAARDLEERCKADERAAMEREKRRKADEKAVRALDEMFNAEERSTLELELKHKAEEKASREGKASRGKKERLKSEEKTARGLEEKLRAEKAAAGLEEKRKAQRLPINMPEFVSVEFKTGKGPKKEKTYNLNVTGRSKNGFSLLVTQKDFDLLKTVDVGDRLKGMMCFATTAMIKVDATVRHKTKIKKGEHKGCYILGVESADIIPEGKLGYR